jgi:pilus assembly protein FimV
MLYKMHNYKKTPVNFFGNKIVKAAALSSLLVFSNAYATGLGKLTVLSSLGQPLKAEIELTSVNKEDVASLVPKISSLETFKQANIDFNPALLNLKFAVVPKGNGYVIKVTSTQPMNEPWVDFLLEMKAESGRLVREYTFLLDPAELMTGQAAQVAVPAPVISAIKPSVPVTSNLEIRRELETSPQRGELVKKTNTSVSSGTRTTQNSGDYKVRSGDTLMKIASQHLNGVSLDQMLVGIYQANPDAFVGNNMNRLKAGQVLSIPASSDLQGVSNSEARSIISAHTSDFNAYRNRLAGQVNRVPQEKNETIKQTSSNAITTKVKESTTGVNSSVDKLKLSKLERANDAQDKNAKRISEEDRLAKEKALQDANARVKELEKNVLELNKLLAVPTKSAVVQAPIINKVAEKPAEPKPVEVKKSAPKVASTSAIAAVASSARTSVASANTKPVVRPKKPAPPAPPVEESGWFDNPYILPISGLLLALLAAFGFYSSRKKRAAHQFEDSILTGSSLKANSMFGSTGGQSVDTNNSVFNSNFAPSASQLDANEVDPVAEADVYIAYGRDSQAEEILREALRTQPERHAVRLKLLEIYYARKDQKSFDLLAGEMYGMTRGEGDDWAQAASMGLSLDPSNPLYAGASPQAEAYLPGISLPTQPLEDFETDALLDTGLSPDMLDSISIIDIASGHTDHSIQIPDESMSTKQPLEDSFDIDGLDFDLDIDDSSLNLEQDAPTIPEISNTATKADEIESIPSIDFSSIDFDLGGDQSSNLVQEENIQNEDDLQSLSTSSAIDSLDLNSSIEGNHLNVETSSLDIEDNLQTSEVGSVDIEDLSFDTDEKELNQTELESSTGIYNAEMATKLDLAVAYQEIGDREGARELLDEVIKGGSSDQIEKAKEMLKQIS